MKFIRYINEMELSNVNDIIKNCKPFLQFMGRIHWKYLFQRFATQHAVDNFELRTARQDRNPVDTPNHVHKLFDDLFMKYYQWRPRSSGVFVWPRKVEAFSVGPFKGVFPVGDFDLLWSPEVEDLFVAWNDYQVETQHSFRDNEAEILKWAEDLVQSYREKKDIQSSIKFEGNEVIFKCDRYYLCRFANGINEYKEFIKSIVIKMEYS